TQSSFSFFVQPSPHPPHLHSFPTRRSSDLYPMITLETMPPLMFGGLILAMLIGFPVAFTLAALGLSFGFLSIYLGFFDMNFLQRSEEHTSELQSRSDLVCRLLLEKKKKKKF